MPLFLCKECGVVESTGLVRGGWHELNPENPESVRLCSQCCPTISEWHGKWPRHYGNGMYLASDGYLYDADHIDSGRESERFKKQGIQIVRKVGYNCFPGLHDLVEDNIGIACTKCDYAVVKLDKY